MKTYFWIAAVGVLAVPSGTLAQTRPPLPHDTAANGRAANSHRVLFVNASEEGVTCVAPSGWMGTCEEAPVGRALTSLHAVELQVINHRFLTDYSVEITAKTELDSRGIRGLEEASSLSLSAPSLIPPPAKGPVPAIDPKTATTILAALLDETESGSQDAILKADEAELDQQVRSFSGSLATIEDALARLLGTPSAAYGTNLGSPSLGGVLSALTATIAEARAGPFAEPPYRDEQAFRTLNVRVRDRIALMRHLQRVVSETRLPDQVADLLADLTQIARNEATFAGNRRAAASAVELYQALRQLPDARARLRREQLRLMFRNQLKLAPASAEVIVDEAELNALTDAYLMLLERRGFRVADARVDALAKLLVALETRAATREAQIADLRTRAARVGENVRLTLPREVAAVNAAFGTLLARVNEIYDLSRTSTRLSKIVDLSGYSANTFGYAVRRVERFARYAIAGAPVLAVAAPAPPAAAPLPPAASAVKPAPATGAPVKPAPAASAQAPDAEDPPATPAPAGEGEVVATGTFEVHQMDRAAVIAGFAFSSIRQTEYTARQLPAAGDRPAGLYPIAGSESRGQPHVLLGINYYLQPRDTYPEADKRLSHFGITAGVSLNELHNYFLGGLWEPKLGFNLGAGLHFGKRKELQEPYKSGEPIPDATVPTFDKRTVGLYIQAGLDVDIFRKVFGKASGVGTAASRATAGR